MLTDRQTLTFVIEAVYAVDAGTLMITTQQEKVFRILYLIRQQQADRFQRLLAPVHVVAQEQVIGFRWEAAVLEQPQQVRVLAVDVAADL